MPDLKTELEQIRSAAQATNTFVGNAFAKRISQILATHFSHHDGTPSDNPTRKESA